MSEIYDNSTPVELPLVTPPPPAVSRSINCTFTFTTRSFIAIFDTGANKNFISRKIIKLIPHNILKFRTAKNTSTFILADNTIVRSTEKVYLNLIVNKIDIEDWFEIFEDMPDEIIIGLKFMARHHIKLNTVDYTWTWKYTDDTYYSSTTKLPGLIYRTITAEQDRLNEFLDREFEKMKAATLSTITVVEHKIELTDSKPIRVKNYCRTPIVRQAMHMIVDNMLADGVIRPSTSE